MPRKRWLVPLVVLVVAGAAVWFVRSHSGVTLSGDDIGLARIHTQALGGKLESATARTATGKAVPLDVDAGRLIPKARLTPGEQITVDVVVRRPGSLSWLLGKTRHERVTVRAPVAHVSSRWLTVARGAAVTVAFDSPVARVASHTLATPERSVSLGRRPPAGSAQVAVAARSWERLQRPVEVSWFPKTARAALVSAPVSGAKLSPLGSVRLTFADTVKKALGDRRPSIAPRTPGRFSRPDAHTLVFTPSGSGFGIGGGSVRMTLPKAAVVVSPSGRERTTRVLSWTVPPPSTLRLQQLLAEGGYLPLDWHPSGDHVARTRVAQARAAVDAPKGDFAWRYPNTPPELKKLWDEGQANAITRGAIMKFQDTHGLTVDGFAGPAVWGALLKDTLAGKRRTDGYSYVFVHRDTPQLLTLWHNGHVVLTSPGNTGVPAAPTKLGTFPVFEHIPVTTMSGTNPDGSHYRDPGIKWVSYFNGGDALHAFNRASFGTPQSLGCVELPEASAKKVYPYTPIGTLVTIEH